MVLKLIAVERCYLSFEKSVSGVEYGVLEGCRIVAITTISRLEQVLEMLQVPKDVAMKLIEKFEELGDEVYRCTNDVCWRLRPILVAL